MESREYNDIRPEDISNSSFLSRIGSNTFKIGSKLAKLYGYMHIYPTFERKLRENANENGEQFSLLYPEDMETNPGDSKVNSAFRFVGATSVLTIADPLLYATLIPGEADPKLFAIAFATPLLTNVSSLFYEGGRYLVNKTRGKLASEEKQRKTEILEQSRQYEGLLEKEFDERLNRE